MGRRVAFRDTVYFDELTEFAERAGWEEQTPGGEPVQGTEPHEFETWHFRWQTSDGAPIEFIDDESIECQLLDIDERAADTVEPAVRRSFEVFDATEAAEAYLADSDKEHRERFLRMIAGVVPRREDEVLADVIMDGLHDNAPMVRLAAIIAAGATRWSRFEERLTTLSTHDPDPNFRLLAKNSLKELKS